MLRPTAGTYSFDPLEYADPLVHEFAGNTRAGLLSTIVNRYFRLKKPPTQSAHVALAFRPTGDPAIVDRENHRRRIRAADRANPSPRRLRPPRPSPLVTRPYSPGGRSILVALPVSFASIDPATKQPWSNWPLKSSFQPMMQNLLLAAIGPQGADRNVLVGQPLESSLPVAAASAALVLQNPDGRKEQIRIAARDESNRWSYADTWQSGIYRAEMPSAASQNRLYAVNINPNGKRPRKDRPCNTARATNRRPRVGRPTTTTRRPTRHPQRPRPIFPLPCSNLAATRNRPSLVVRLPCIIASSFFVPRP